MVQRMERDAEVDALKASLAAAEARAERAVGLLREAATQLEYLDEKFQQTGTTAAVVARIAALLKEVSHGQQG